MPESSTEEVCFIFDYLGADGEERTISQSLTLNHNQKKVFTEVGLSELSGNELKLPINVNPLRSVEYLPELSSKEIHRRLPELSRITDSELHDQVMQVLISECPEHYWSYPASTSGNYHPPDERTLHGQWIHTKRFLSLFDYFTESPLQRRKESEKQNSYEISEWDRQCGLAAGALHDILKFGQTTEVTQTVSDHDIAAAELLDKHYDFPEVVLNCVATHNGPWREGPQPQSFIELIFHYTDMIVANRRNTSILSQPAPEILLSYILWRVRSIVPDAKKYTLIVQDTQSKL